MVRNPVLLHTCLENSWMTWQPLIGTSLPVKAAASPVSVYNRKEVVTKQVSRRSNTTLSLPSLTPLFFLFKSGSFGLHLPCPVVPQTVFLHGHCPLVGGGYLEAKGMSGSLMFLLQTEWR